jgi:hypothetical protein
MPCCGEPFRDTDLQEAKCHICTAIRPCSLCTLCGHWFCVDCNPRLIARTVAAVREIIGGPTPGCCGPVSATYSADVHLTDGSAQR